jgi:integrase
MRTRFYIEKRKDERGHLFTKDRPVFMSVSFGGKRVILGTGLKVDMNGWDSELQRIRTSYSGALSQNEWLMTMQETAGKAMEALEHSGNELNSDSFRNLFNQLKPEYSSGFFDLFFQFMERKSSTWSSASYRKVRTLYNLLREFEDSTGYSISFYNLNAEFLDLFSAYCLKKGYKYSTTYKSVNNLVWFLNWATDNGYNVNREYKKFYKLMDAPGDKSRLLLFLHWDELMLLKEFTTENRRMERIRDLFCFMCFSGVRFSELQQMKKEDLKPGEISIHKPGGGGRLIPMNKYAEEIYQKYENKYYLNNRAFPSMSIITMNKYLRLMGKEIGLTRQLPPQGEEEDSQPLYRRLTAGIAVSTFIRNAIEMEVPFEIISLFTGIQNDSRVRQIKANLAIEEMKKFNPI